MWNTNSWISPFLGTSLRCYKCDDKQIGLDWCSQPEEEECENDDSSICLKYVYRAGKKSKDPAMFYSLQYLQSMGFQIGLII